MMSDAGHDAFMAENLLTIPLGCLVLVDSACECVVDTVCYPADYFIAKSRKSQPVKIESPADEIPPID